MTPQDIVCMHSNAACDSCNYAEVCAGRLTCLAGVEDLDLKP